MAAEEALVEVAKRTTSFRSLPRAPERCSYRRREISGKYEIGRKWRRRRGLQTQCRLSQRMDICLGERKKVKLSGRTEPYIVPFSRCRRLAVTFSRLLFSPWSPFRYGGPTYNRAPLRRVRN